MRFNRSEPGLSDESRLRSGFSFKQVAVGGTFDVLHSGHERLLARAFELGAFVFIGVSGDDLVTSLKKNHEVRKFADRRRSLAIFLRAHGWQKRSRIVELKDPFGPAATERNLEALVVSQVTRDSGMRVNEIRRTKELPPLKMFVVRLVKAEDGKPISTTRIRRREIDIDGTLFRR